MTTELIDTAEVRDGKAIVTYSRTEAALADLRDKYAGATYDLTTTAGDKAARAGRLELKTLRTSLEDKRKELKAPALEFGKKIDSEAARLTAEIMALEQPIDNQIKADEIRRENERRAKEEAEAARRKVHTDAIAKIAGYVALATDLQAERIANGIGYLEGLDLAGFEEYQTEATEARARTIEALRALHAKAVAREDEAARLEVERAEQARVAAEQAETARKLKAQQDDLDRQRAELAAQQAAATPAPVAATPPPPAPAAAPVVVPMAHPPGPDQRAPGLHRHRRLPAPARLRSRRHREGRKAVPRCRLPSDLRRPGGPHPAGSRTGSRLKCTPPPAS